MLIDGNASVIKERSITEVLKCDLTAHIYYQVMCRFVVSGKATGIVTNTRITHATPAALYGHSPSRYWEDDSKVPPASRKSCKDLARQLIENDPGRNINVSTSSRLPVFIPFNLH